MNSPTSELGLATQVFAAYDKESPPRHIIICGSPLSAFLSRRVFGKMVNDTVYSHPVPEHVEKDRLPAFVRCFIQAAWQGGSSEVRKLVEERVKCYAKDAITKS